MTQEFRERLTLRPEEYHNLAVVEDYVRWNSQQKPWETVLDRSEFDALYNPETETVTFRLKDRKTVKQAGVAVAMDVDDLAVMPEQRIVSMLGNFFMKYLELGLPPRAKGTAYHTEFLNN